MNKIIYLMPLLLAAAACSHDHGHSHQAEEAEEHHHHHGENEIVFHQEQAERFGVTTQVIAPGDFSEVVKVSGQIYPAQNNVQTIVATKAGIARLGQGINIGSQVGRGQAVALISASQIIGGDQDRSAEITLENARREYERISALYDDRLVTEGEYVAARQAYQQAQNAFKPSTATPTAPIGGTITAIYVSDGDYVEVGAPIASISASNTLILRADLPERYASMTVRSANFRPSYSDTTLSLQSLGGKMIAPADAAIPTTGYLPVYFSFGNTGGLVARSYADVYLIGATRHNVITVPVAALTEEQGDYFVYEKLDAECYTKHKVTTGASDGERIEITAGIHEGMEIVTQGAVIVKLAATAGAVPGHSHEH